MIVGVLSAPLSALAAAVLYFELRARSTAAADARRVNAMASAELLRPGLLEGVSIMLAHDGTDAGAGQDRRRGRRHPRCAPRSPMAPARPRRA